MSPSEIIDAIGGTNKVAKLCEVSKGAVSQWRTDGIPAARLMYLKVVRPEVFCPPKNRRSQDRRAEK